MTRADVGAQQLPALLEHGGAERPALRQASAAATCASKRASCSLSSRRSVVVQLVEAHPPVPVRPHIVPGLVREALHVVGQVAGELDDGRADTRLRPEAASSGSASR